MRFTAAATALLVIVVFLGNFVFLLNNHSYHSEFQKLGLNKTVAANVADFVNGKSALSNEFNEAEASHLNDVKGVFTAIRRFYYFSLLMLLLIILYSLQSKKFNQLMPKSLILSGSISLALLLLIFLSSLNFTAFFGLIHKPFFAPNSWVFPADSLLIKSFPEQFFRGFAKNMFLLIFINSAVFLGIGLYIRKKFKQRTPKALNDSP